MIIVEMLATRVPCGVRSHGGLEFSEPSSSLDVANMLTRKKRCIAYIVAER